MDHSSLKKPFSLSPTPKQESYHQITNWLQELEELKLDNERVKKYKVIKLENWKEHCRAYIEHD